MTRPRRLLVAAVAALTAATLLAACSGSDDGDDFSERTAGDGGESSIQVGPSATLPGHFPSSQVPLPEAGALQAAIVEGRKPNRYYTLTFGLGGRSGNAVGDEYRDRLDKAGYQIKNFSAIEGDDVRLTTFDAIGDDWDVAVVSGKASRNEPQALSVQVSTHGTLITDIEEMTELDEGTSNPDPGIDSTTSSSTP
jgi:hypothetical protein